MYAVIFTSLKSDNTAGYAEMNAEVYREVTAIDGFMFEESCRQADGSGISVSYWRDLDAIDRWRNNALHCVAKQHGRESWFDSYSIRICKVESEKEFNRNAGGNE